MQMLNPPPVTLELAGQIRVECSARLPVFLQDQGSVPPYLIDTISLPTRVETAFRDVAREPYTNRSVCSAEAPLSTRGMGALSLPRAARRWVGTGTVMHPGILECSCAQIFYFLFNLEYF